MANLLSRCGRLTDFLLSEGNTQAEINAAGLQGAQVVSLTFDLSSADRLAAGAKKKAAKAGKKKAAKGGKKKAAKGGKKSAKGGRKNK